jgi:adenine-specific DNA-methyltransferase
MAKKATRGNSGPKPVESIKHKDKRTNIPTEELRDFVAEDEQKPKTMLYARDPSLDPQLVWKGKDEQDQKDLAVPVVPVYIQEKIHPQALIENLRDTTKAGEKEPEQLLFSDFNGIDDDFARKVDFYSHDLGSQPKWTNRMILGDSLLVMTSLAEKEGLKGKVQTIYVDPPYGIRFGSNWQVSTRKRDVHDGRAEDTTRQPEQIRAFRDTWKLGIHSYLAYLRDRLTIARELLTDTGSIFVQIGDENVHLVRSILDEVFGSENFGALLIVRKSGGTTAELIASPVDYLLWYAKNRQMVKYRQLYSPKSGGSEGAGVYSRVMEPDGAVRRMTDEEMLHPDSVPSGSRILRFDVITSQGFRANTTVPFEFQGKTYHPGPSSNWKATIPGMERLSLARRIAISGSSLAYVRFVDDFPVYPLDSVWEDTGTGSFTDPKVYVVQTGTKTIQRCVLMTTDPGDLVLDPTCGSGTSAYVAEQWGRRWITIDTSRVALALTSLSSGVVVG